MHIHVQVFGWTRAFISLGVEWLDCTTGARLNFLRNRSTVSRISSIVSILV